MVLSKIPKHLPKQHNHIFQKQSLFIIRNNTQLIVDYREKSIILKVSAPEAWELTQEYEEKGKRLTEKEEHRLKKLGNIIDDVLLMIEQEAIGAGKDPFTEKRITTLIDIYAGEFDEILRKHRVGMVSEIKKLLKKLVNDLEKITN